MKKKILKDEKLDSINGGLPWGEISNQTKNNIRDWLNRNMDEIIKRINGNYKSDGGKLVAYTFSAECNSLQQMKKFINDTYGVSVDDLQ